MITLDLSKLPRAPEAACINRGHVLTASRKNPDGVVRLARFLGLKTCSCPRHRGELVDAVAGECAR